MVSCSGGGQATDNTATQPAEANQQETEEAEKKAPQYAITEVDIQLPLDQDMITQGKGIAEMKCTSCHSLGADKLVGPGWLGITSRRTPEWIMNMITDVDLMLSEDEEAQKLFEECLVRMPNQNISVDEARSVLEYMREIDGVE